MLHGASGLSKELIKVHRLSIAISKQFGFLGFRLQAEDPQKMLPSYICITSAESLMSK